MSEYGICSHIPEKKKKTVEYARIILNVPDAVHSIKSSTIYWAVTEADVFRALSSI